jgi:membrane protease YdiL (CAAX protease family)
LTLATWLAVRFLERGSLRNLGLAWQRGAWTDLMVGLALPPVLLGGVFALEWMAGWLLIAGTGQAGVAFIARSLWWSGAVAWYEELFARGYLLQTLARFCRPFAANLLTAMVFAGLHLANPGVSGMAMVGVLLAGVFLGLCYQVTRSLYLPMAFHMSWNLTQALLGFPVSGTRQPGLLHLVREGPALYTGGRFGPEAGLAGFLVIAVAMGVVWEYGKKRRAA